jgi:DNA polymerase-3 subunit gamma/tau
LAELMRAWQILLKGHQEAQQAALPLQAAEMVLIRLAHASDLPTPGELVRQLQGQESRAAVPRPAIPSGGGSGGARAQAVAPRLEAAPAPAPARTAEQPKTELALHSFPALIALLRRHKEAQLADRLEVDVSLVAFGIGRLVLHTLPSWPKDEDPRLRRLLAELTGRAWEIDTTAPEPGEPPLREVARQQAAASQAAALQHPLAQSLLQTFPGAKVVAHRRPGADPGAAEPALPEAGADATPPAEYQSEAEAAEAFGELIGDED